MKQPYDYTLEEFEQIRVLISNIICDLSRIKIRGRLPDHYANHIEKQIDMYGKLLAKTDRYIDDIFEEAYRQEFEKRKEEQQ